MNTTTGSRILTLKTTLSSPIPFNIGGRDGKITHGYHEWPSTCCRYPPCPQNVSVSLVFGANGLAATDSIGSQYYRGYTDIKVVGAKWPNQRCGYVN